MIVLLSLLRKRPKRSVLLVSLDGFRREYLERGLTPTLNRISDDGILADYLISVFPSITFPNHYSIATGLFPETHGIVSNLFYDSELNDTYNKNNDTNNRQSKWWGGEPIWKTVQRFGKSAAVIMWPGSTGIIPDFLIPYVSMDIYQKCNHIMDWHENYDIQLYMMYVPDIDVAGHQSGANSLLMNETISRIDDGISYLLSQLSERYLDWDIIIVSDHGMTNLSDDRIIYLDDMIDMSQVNILSNGPFMMIYPKNQSDISIVYENLYRSKANFRVWNTSTLPKEYHFAHKSRVGPIISQAELGYSFTTRSSYNGNGTFQGKGNHGYPSEDPDMHGIFLAYGPSFQKGKRIDSFHNTEIYQLISHLLGITPSFHNGTKDWMEKMKAIMQ